MTEIALTDAERTTIVLLVASQINRVQTHREMRLQTEELLSILQKIQGVDTQLVARRQA